MSLFNCLSYSSISLRTPLSYLVALSRNMSPSKSIHSCTLTSFLDLASFQSMRMKKPVAVS